MADFIPLQCPTCGAKLEVHGDMERFACGFCGNQVMVQRRGGTVALKAVANAIGRVQEGTDRIAGELELRRLQQEVSRLRVEAAPLRSRLADLLEKEEAGGSPGLGPLVAVALALAISSIAGLIGTAIVSFRYGVMPSIAFGVFVGVLIVWNFTEWTKSGPAKLRATQAERESVEEAVREIDNRLATMETRIAELRSLLA